MSKQGGVTRVPSQKQWWTLNAPEPCPVNLRSNEGSAPSALVCCHGYVGTLVPAFLESSQKKPVLYVTSICKLLMHSTTAVYCSSTTAGIERDEKRDAAWMHLAKVLNYQASHPPGSGASLLFKLDVCVFSSCFFLAEAVDSCKGKALTTCYEWETVAVNPQYRRASVFSKRNELICENNRGDVTRVKTYSQRRFFLARCPVGDTDGQNCAQVKLMSWS